eukprot:74308_1
MVTVALIVCALICSAQSLQRTKQTSFYIALPNSIQTGVSVFIQKVAPNNPNPLDSKHDHDFVLIWLHGASYSSQTWIDLNILSSLTKKKGYTSYAMDIPGYGKSSNYFFADNQWLIYVIKQILHKEININKFVLVTASMSGMYAMPLLIENQKDLENNNNYQIGLIAVAPVDTNLYDKQEYESVSMSICIIYGEKDIYIGLPAKQDLVQTPTHTVFMIPNADHACYEDNPTLFIEDIIEYLKELNSNTEHSVVLSKAILMTKENPKELLPWSYILIVFVVLITLCGIHCYLKNHKQRYDFTFSDI